MKCRFLQHGIALSYNNIVKPCCVWKVTPEWRANNHVSSVDIVRWHTSPQVVAKQAELASGAWPAECAYCEDIESQGREDSIRGNGNHSYAGYTDQDITLEIRPGSTCNFACQTCWPAASSRVAQYHSQAGLIDIKSVDATRIDDFEFLLPVADRLKDVIVLGGEPFYDKSCRRFLDWAQANLTANLMMFTNGSIVDFEFLNDYRGRFTLIVSLDAVGRPAEYIRYGTEWVEVYKNYLAIRELDNVETRVNITTSVYNYRYIEEVIDLLCNSWPAVVSFGSPDPAYLKETAVPLELREEIITSLLRAIAQVEATDIESGQKSNAINALKSIVVNLETLPFDPAAHSRLADFVAKMDRVKGIAVADYCGFLSRLVKVKLS
jgi:sulfatase maturation enzyme AslB (radical SAM superfamily)